MTAFLHWKFDILQFDDDQQADLCALRLEELRPLSIVAKPERAFAGSRSRSVTRDTRTGRVSGRRTAASAG